MDAIFSGLGLFRESIFIFPTYPKFMGVPPGLPVHVLDEHSHHLDFPNAFSIFFYLPRLRQDWDHESLFHKIEMIIQYRYNMKMTHVIRLVHTHPREKPIK